MSGAERDTATDARMDLAEAFRTATGQQLSEAGEAGLRRFAEAAGIKGNDALWMILFGFEMYRNLYADVPRQVGEAAGLVVRQEAEALREHGERVKAAMQAAMAEKAGDMHKALIAELLRELKSGAARKVIEEQAREAMKNPMQDAAGKLERLAAAAHSATDRYQAAHKGVGGLVGLLTVGVVAGLVGGLLVRLLS